MKKALICFISLIMTMTMVVGCGSKENNNVKAIKIIIMNQLIKEKKHK